MSSPRPVIATGQQIGAGWTPALSVAKALAALALARSRGGEAVFWMADEDHDRLEVARTAGWEGDRLRPHRFGFDVPRGTATGWLPWADAHQREAEALWGEVPETATPTLRGHFEALGAPLWERGIRPYSPTLDPRRAEVQATLTHWRGLDLESDLLRQAERLRGEGAPVPLDPAQQHAWFALDPRSGLRRALERGEACPPGAWLSPGASLRPLLQSLLLPVSAVVLGPAERAYWRLCEPLWERVGLTAPEQLARPSVVVLPRGMSLTRDQLDPLQQGDWAAFAPLAGTLPSTLAGPRPDTACLAPTLAHRLQQAWVHYQGQVAKLDRRALRDAASGALGVDAERLRQRLFPLGRPQERVLPGLAWLRDGALLDRILAAMAGGGDLILVEAS